MIPRLFSYEVFTIEQAYTKYYVSFSVKDFENLPNIVYRWTFGDSSPTVNGKDVVHNYLPGEYTAVLAKSINAAPFVDVESTIVYVVAIPGSKLPSNQIQPVNTVELYPTVGLKQSISLPIKTLEIGDSHAQANSSYVNEYDEDWNITTGIITDAQKDRLDATFQQLAGVSPFNFVPIAGDAPVSLTCESWSHTQLSINDFQLSIQAKRYWSHAKPVFASPPFLGGQCLAVLYRVDVVIPRPLTGQIPQEISFLAYGNIESIKLPYDPNVGGGQTQLTVRSHGAALGSDYYPDIREEVVAALGYPGQLYFSSIVITRNDGLPDTCGNPTPQL